MLKILLYKPSSRAATCHVECSNLDYYDLLARVEEHPLKGHQLNFNTSIDIYVQLPSDEMGEGGVKIYVL